MSKNAKLLEQSIKQSGLTQEGYSRLVNIAGGQLSALKQGDVRFTHKICAKLAKAGVATFEKLLVNQAIEDAKELADRYDLSGIDENCIKRRK